MTRETAIEILKELWRTKYPLYLESDIRKALEMAIQSLEQEPKYCDRNICLRNEYNNIGCDECEVVISREQADVEITDDDIATMRILFNAEIGHFCNQGRHKDAEEMEQIRDRLMARLQADDDAISRQALLDAFGFSEKTRKWGGDHSGYNTMMLYEIQDIIESQPPVNPQEPKKKYDNRWFNGYAN